jgi:hypothetical protein
MFSDVNYRKKFSDYLNQTKNEKPYRSADGKIRYPLGNRRYSNRHWEFLNNNPNSGSILLYYQNSLLGIAHSDDSFEYRMEVGRTSYGQGEAGAVSQAGPGWVYSCSNLGGGIYQTKKYRSGEESVKYPLFEGLRVNMSDGLIHHSCQYLLHTNILNRKETTQYRKPYEQMFKLADIMLRNMQLDAIHHEFDDHILAFKSVRYGDEAMLEFALQNTDDAVATVMRLAVVFNYKSTSYSSRYLVRSYSNSLIDTTAMVKSIRTMFYEHLYSKASETNSKLFTEKVTQPGGKLPTASWGQEVRLNGVAVKRYV